MERCTRAMVNNTLSTYWELKIRKLPMEIERLSSKTLKAPYAKLLLLVDVMISYRKWLPTAQCHKTLSNTTRQFRSKIHCLHFPSLTQ